MRDYWKNKNVQDSVVVLLLGVALAVYSLVSFYTATVQTAWIMSPYLFPLLLAVFAVLLSVSLFAEGSHEVKEARQAAEPPAKAAPLAVKKVLFVVALGVIYYLLISVIHFVPASVLFLAALIWYLGERKYIKIALISVIMPLVLYVLFAKLLNVRLP